MDTRGDGEGDGDDGDGDNESQQHAPQPSQASPVPPLEWDSAIAAATPPLLSNTFRRDAAATSSPNAVLSTPPIAPPAIIIRTHHAEDELQHLWRIFTDVFPRASRRPSPKNYGDVSPEFSEPFPPLPIADPEMPTTVDPAPREAPRRSPLFRATRRRPLAEQDFRRPANAARVPPHVGGPPQQFLSSAPDRRELRFRRRLRGDPPLVEKPPIVHWANLSTLLRRNLPIYNTISKYNLRRFLGDLLGAVNVALVLLPQSVAFSSLARVNPSQTLLSAIFPLLLYPLFGSSSLLSVGPEAVISVIVGSTIQSEQQSNPDADYPVEHVASTLALMVGLFAILLSMMRAGFVDQLLSGYLLTGFMIGLSCLIIMNQAPQLLGLSIFINAQDPSITKITTIARNLLNSRWITVVISFSNIAFLLTARTLKRKFSSKIRFLKYVPEIVVLTVSMTAISYGLDLSSRNVNVLGVIDARVPSPTPPPTSFSLLTSLIEPAVVVLLVGYIECQAVTRNISSRLGRVPSGNRELFALGFSNLVSSFFGTIPTFGGMTRSRLLANTGARTTLSNIMAGIIILILFLYMESVLKYLPRSTLASIVTVGAVGLVDIQEIKFVFLLRSWTEIGMFLFTSIITVVTSITVGVLICIAFSTLLILRKTTTSVMTVMGRVHHSRRIVTPSLAQMNEYPTGLGGTGLRTDSGNGRSFLLENSGPAADDQGSIRGTVKSTKDDSADLNGGPPPIKTRGNNSNPSLNNSGRGTDAITSSMTAREGESDSDSDEEVTNDRMSTTVSLDYATRDRTDAPVDMIRGMSFQSGRLTSQSGTSMARQSSLVNPNRQSLGRNSVTFAGPDMPFPPRRDSTFSRLRETITVRHSSEMPPLPTHPAQQNKPQPTQPPVAGSSVPPEENPVSNSSPAISAAAASVAAARSTAAGGRRSVQLITILMDRPRFVSIREHPDAELLDGLLILRVDVPILFYNVGRLRRTIESLMRAQLRMWRARKAREELEREEAEAEAAAAAAAYQNDFDGWDGEEICGTGKDEDFDGLEKGSTMHTAMDHEGLGVSTPGGANSSFPMVEVSGSSETLLTDDITPSATPEPGLVTAPGPSVAWAPGLTPRLQVTPPLGMRNLFQPPTPPPASSLPNQDIAVDTVPPVAAGRNQGFLTPHHYLNVMNQEPRNFRHPRPYDPEATVTSRDIYFSSAVADTGPPTTPSGIALRSPQTHPERPNLRTLSGFLSSLRIGRRERSNSAPAGSGLPQPQSILPLHQSETAGSSIPLQSISHLGSHASTAHIYDPEMTVGSDIFTPATLEELRAAATRANAAGTMAGGGPDASKGDDVHQSKGTWKRFFDIPSVLERLRHRRQLGAIVGLYGRDEDAVIHPLPLHPRLNPAADGHSEAFISLEKAVHTILLDLSHCFDMDSAGTFVLRSIVEIFAKNGIRFCLCGVHDFQMRLFERAGMRELLLGNVFADIEAAVEEIQDGLDEVIWRDQDGFVTSREAK
ncbi:sulfate transporter family-domain-containing protein [Zopfochytrium polystomum]|nr:sulfate transporter family-domain-containing protein [Zopfochytrium polystomum]